MIDVIFQSYENLVILIIYWDDGAGKSDRLYPLPSTQRAVKLNLFDVVEQVDSVDVISVLLGSILFSCVPIQVVSEPGIVVCL